MKITLELEDFDIYGNNDETPSSFSKELKDEIIKKSIDQMADFHRVLVKNMEKEFRVKAFALEKEVNKQLDEILLNYKKDIDEVISSIKNK